MSHHRDMLEVLDRLMNDLAERGVPGELDAPDHVELVRQCGQVVGEAGE